MKFLVAPTSYKGFFSPSQVAQAIASGLRAQAPESQIELAPIADGGDGTIEALHLSLGGKIEKLEVRGPIGKPVLADWLAITEENQALAVVELASACGLAYLNAGELAPLDASSFGAGEVLNHVRNLGYSNIVITVGGSASTEGGMGILAALGAKFLDADGHEIGLGGRHLDKLASINCDDLSQWRGLRLRVATDVVNPLLGDFGAASIFGPQKGASQDDVVRLDSCLTHYADVLEQTFKREARNVAGAGAAGGVPFGLCLALDAEIIPGFQWLAGLLGLDEKVKEADVVISAEGSLDVQSVCGKATGELARICKMYGTRLWALPALVEANVDWSDYGIERVCATRGEGMFASLADIEQAAANMLRS